jgi:integrase
MRRSSGEGTIVQRKDGLWAGSLRVAGKRYWVYGKTAKDVADKLQALRQQQGQGLLVEPSKLTISDFLRQWLKSTQLTCKPSTVHGYAVVVRCHLIPELGSVKLQKLAPTHLVKLYQAKHQKGLSPRRVAIIHAVIHRALAEAVRWQLIPRNLAACVTPPRREEHEPRVWGLTEVRRFVASAQASESRYAPALVLTLALGLRAAELLGLRWEAIDQEQGQVVIDRALTWVGGEAVWGSPKSRAGRRVLPLPEHARLALLLIHRQQLEARLRAGAAWKDKDGRVVTTATGGVPILNRFKDALDSLCRQAGIPRLTVHQLRHQCASLLFASGADVKQVQTFLGHSRASVTLDVYAHLLGESDGEMAKRLEDLLK